MLSGGKCYNFTLYVQQGVEIINGGENITPLWVNPRLDKDYDKIITMYKKVKANMHILCINTGSLINNFALCNLPAAWFKNLLNYHLYHKLLLLYHSS